MLRAIRKCDKRRSSLLEPGALAWVFLLVPASATFCQHRVKPVCWWARGHKKATIVNRAFI